MDERALVCAYDRAADREAQTRPRGFRGAERIENPWGDLARDSRPVVGYAHLHVPLSSAAGAHHDLPSVYLAKIDGLERVADQVQEDLLHLSLIHRELRQARCQLQAVNDAVRLGIRLDEIGQFCDDRVDVSGTAARFIGTGEPTHAPDDVSCAHGLTGDLAQSSLDFRDVGVGQPQESIAGVSIGGNGRQWLIQLVSDSGGHFADRGKAPHVRQPLLQPRCLLLLLTLEADIVNDSNEAGWLGVRDNTHRKLKGEGATVLTPAVDLAALPNDVRFPGGRITQQIAVVCRPGRFGHEHADILPENLLAAVTEEPLRGTAELMNGAEVIDDHDAIHCCIQQPLQILGWRREVWGEVHKRYNYARGNWQATYVFVQTAIGTAPNFPAGRLLPRCGLSGRPIGDIYVDKLTSILVIADRSPADRGLLLKALDLARAFGARIELYTCDSEHSADLRRAYDTAGVEKEWLDRVWAGRRYLEGLRESVLAADIQIFVDCMCDTRVQLAIARKIVACHPDLVMKAAAHAQPGRFALNSADWELMRACPVNLMLVRDRPWKERLRFAAMVDMRDPETPSAGKEVMHAAEYLAVGCGADLDAVYCEREETAPDRATLAAGLEALAREHQVGSEHVHVLSGDPDEVLPAFAAQNNYDAVILGTLTHRKRLANLVGKLTGRLADALDCDLLLVRSGSTVELIAQASKANIIWQGVFGD